MAALAAMSPEQKLEALARADPVVRLLYEIDCDETQTEAVEILAARRDALLGLPPEMRETFLDEIEQIIKEKPVASPASHMR